MYKENHQDKSISVDLLALVLSTGILLTGCAGTEVADQESAAEEVQVVAEIDPYENLNRKVFVFNEKLDTYVAKPISDAYLWVTPQFVQTGVSNFFSNLKDINVVLNDVLQGKFEQGLEDTGRFTVNSTIGLLGLFDVANEMGLEKHEEDFDQTLAVWGVPEGPYLVLPLLGPTTTRGVPGGIVDTAANPTTYVGLPVQLVSMLNTRANAEGALKFIDEAALDPYVFTRESFLQYRRHLVSDGETEISDDVIDFEDEFYDDDDVDSGNAETAMESLDDEGVQEALTDETKVVATTAGSEAANQRYTLKLSADVEAFDQASGSFDSAVKSFDEASQSFEEVSEKLDRLERL